jgi:polar amino acid transport system permease protein
VNGPDSSGVPREPIARLRPRAHPRIGTWVIGALVAAITLLAIQSLALNPNLRWPVVARYLFDRAILEGVLATIQLTVFSQVIALGLGFAAALGLQARNPVINAVSAGYIGLFRGTPLLVQLLFWYNLALLFPTIFLGLPFTDWGVRLATNDVISGFTAALLGLACNEGAYMAEIVRGGILAVPKGQMEAALAARP